MPTVTTVTLQFNESGIIAVGIIFLVLGIIVLIMGNSLEKDVSKELKEKREEYNALVERLEKEYGSKPE
jgi:uncharacterized membrane protein